MSEENDLGAEAMRDDPTQLQNAKVFAPAPQASDEGRSVMETTLADVAHIPPSGLTDADVRRLEHPNEFPRVRTLPADEPKPVGRCVGVVDEYGTVWSGEPGASRIVGDLVPRKHDEETSLLYLRRKWWRR